MTRAMKLLMPILIVAGAALPASTVTYTFKVNGTSRTALVYVPAGTAKPPLVISMHGVGIPASWNQGMMLFEPIADTAKFIVVYPSAVNLSWDLSGTSDINFITTIIDSMVKKFNVDRTRVYASGFSMGGMMSWYLECKIPDKIAAIVPGDGYPLGGASGCSETRHVPALHIHGLADDFVAYSGIHAFLKTVETRYGCPTKADTTKPYPVGKDGRDSAQLASKSGSYYEHWGPCTKNGLTSEVNLISVDGMVHDWATPGKANANSDTKYKGKPFDINGTWEAWNFMRQWSLSGTTGVLDQSALRSGQARISANYATGRIQLESDLALRAVKVTDLQGRTLLSWETDDKPKNGLALPISLGRGVYLVDANGDGGHSAVRFVVP